MELRQLKYFKEACERQNFSEAARILHISQSTLSQQIKQFYSIMDFMSASDFNHPELVGYSCYRKG
jgi:LysR family transcriptional regulator, cyn operon transcriptional activator